MDAPDQSSATKRALWANVLALMERTYGGENLTRLARDTGMGPGSTTRIKEQCTSVGIDVLEKIADAFGVLPWQLLAPDMGANLYVLDDSRRLVPSLAPHAQRPIASPRPSLRIAATSAPAPMPAGDKLEATIRRSREKGKKNDHHKNR